MMRIGRTTRMLAAILAVQVLPLTGTVPTANAAVDQVCALNEVIVWNPPLTNTPQNMTFTVHGQLFNCTNSSVPTGSYSETGMFPNATCELLLGAGPGTRVFHWTDPAVAPSTFSYNLTVNRVLGYFEVVAVGSIVSGTFTSQPAKSVGVALQPDPLACATTGVRRHTAVGTLTIGV